MGGFLGAAFRSFSGRILGAASALVAAYSVTSNLSIGDSGLFFLSLGFAIFFAHLLTLGLDNFVLKKCAIFLNERSYPEFLSIVLVSVLACIVGSVLIYLILHASAWVVSYKYVNYLLLIFPAGVAAALLGIIAHSLHASGFVFTGALTNTSLHYILFSIFVWLFPPPSVNEVIVLFSIACYTTLVIQIAVALFLYAIKGIKFTEWKNVRLSNVDYQELHQTALPLWMIIIAQQLNQWGAQFISSVHVAEAELALLAIAMRIALLVPMVLVAVNMVVSPKFAALYHRGEIEKTEEVLTKSLKLLAVVCSFIFVVMILFGSNVLGIFGEQYMAAAGLLSILVCGQLVNGLTGPCGKLLIMSGFEKDVRNTSIMVTAIGLSLAFVLVAKYGVYGAAISTALTIATQNIAIAYIVKYRLRINLIRIYSNFF
ncbi:MAG: MATE family efflux transporter [Granulosicoccaceae bacterium]